MPAGRRSDAALRAGLAEVTRARAAAQEGDAAGAGALIEALSAPPPVVREAAARAIATVAKALQGGWPGEPFAPSRTVDALLSAMRNADEGAAASDPGCRVRQQPVIAIGELGARPAAVEADLRRAIGTIQMENIGGVMEDTAVTLRANAALVMAHTGCDCLCDLGLLLFDGLPDPVTRADPTEAARLAAARAIALLRDPAGAALVAVRLRETRESGEVIGACLDALVALGHPRTVEWALPLLDDRRPQAAVGAGVTVAALDPERACSALPPRIATAEEDLAEALTFALAAARAPGVREALERLAADRRPRVRQAALAAARRG